MKRGTPDHPKTRQLAVMLGLKRYEVVGILESLWHFAASYAKRGDIGRWSNAAIAAALEWTADADALVASLLTAGFLDADSQYRLLVHDWPDHADQTVCRSEEVKKLGFAKRTPAESSNPLPDHDITPPNASQPKPEPLPKPRPSQSHSRAVAEAVAPLADAMPPGEPAPPAGDTASENGSEIACAEPSASGDSDGSGSEAAPPHAVGPDSPLAAKGLPQGGVTAQAPLRGPVALPGANNFAVTVGVKLRLADIGSTPQGQADSQCFGSLYLRHVLPGHLGPPGDAVRLCYSEALRIGDDNTRENKASTFVGCIKKHLAQRGHDWDEAESEMEITV